MPSKANLAIYQGDDYAAVVTVLNGSDAPPDLAGYQAQAQIRNGAADSNPDILVEINTSIQAPNLVNLWIPNSDTVGLSGPYAWDLQLIAPDGIISTILAGNVTVTPEVTRE